MAEYKTLAEALAAFQAVVPKMSKDETAKVSGEGKNGPVKYTYGYAGLDQFVDIVEPVLGAHGLAVTSKTVFTPEGGFILEVALVHESGERETAVWPLPDPRRSGPQDIGSAMTYGRRYLGWGLTGTFPGGVDDDGAQAQQTARESWENAQPRPAAQAQESRPAQNRPVSSPPAPPAVRKTAWTDAEVAEQHAKLTQLPMDQAVVLYDWMAGKGLHGRGIGPSGKTATLLLALRLGDAALLPDAAPEEIATMRDLADSRGLLKVKVSESETLDEVLHTGRELAVHAAVAQAKADTPDPADLKDA